MTELGIFYKGSPYLLPGQGGGQLTRNGLWAKVSRMGQRALNGPIEVAPHDFRRTFVSSLLANGAIEAAVKQIAGDSRHSGTFGHYGALRHRALYREVMKVYADDPL